MKKIFILTFLSGAIIFLTNCSGPKKAAAPRKLTYITDVQALVEQNCSPCHIPAKGGKKKPYDNFTAVKTDIDDIIRRIELQPAVRGFMPFRGNKLSDSTINAIKQWRTDGLLEK